MKNVQEKYQVEAGEAGMAADAPWYVVRTNFHQERRAKFYLERNGFEVYLPMRLGKCGRRGERQVHPLLPRFVFVTVPYVEREWHKLLTTEGVSEVISSGGHPSRVRADHIARIKAEEIGGLIRIKPKAVNPEEKPFPYKAGDQIKVKFPERMGGAGLTGGATIDAIFEERVDTNRIAILFTLLERDHRVVVPLEVN